MVLPKFSEIQVEKIVEEVKIQLENGRSLVDSVASSDVDPTWENIIEPLDLFDVSFGNYWSQVSHLWSVMNTPELSQAFQESLPLISEYATEMGQNEKLYEKYKAIAQSSAYQNFSTAQKKVIEDALIDFHLSGVALSEEKRNSFKSKHAKLVQLQATFEQNLLDSGNAWTRSILDEKELAGVPENSRSMFRKAAEDRKMDGWLLTLDFPFYLAIMQYADSRELRYDMYKAYTTRASDLGLSPEKWDNTALIADILQIRFELANLLSYQQYAELSLAKKMAESSDQVLSFILELVEKSKSHAEDDINELKAFTEKLHPGIKMEPWDIPYFSEKLRQEKFKFSSEDLRPYFSLPNVLDGLFKIVGKLFDVSICQVENEETWHPDVMVYEISDSNSKRGHFYLDLFARPKKRGGAWMDSCRDRCFIRDTNQNPVAYLVCNFSPPVNGKPSLLNHDEVMTLFHEFGHGLHHLLTKVDFPSVSGINGVPWDAVELPSQFLENWCWQEEALNLFARHVDDGHSLPSELLHKMKKAKNFQAGMQMVRQLEFALFDWLIHSNYETSQSKDVLDVLTEVRSQVAVVDYPDWNRFPHSFHHVFGGGYAAGYYSYKWAEVLSADAFSLFLEKGIFDQETGKAFLENILEKGGSEPAMNLFKSFRGREPQVEALLVDGGFIQPEKES